METRKIPNQRQEIFQSKQKKPRKKHRKSKFYSRFLFQKKINNISRSMNNQKRLEKQIYRLFSGRLF